MIEQVLTHPTDTFFLWLFIQCSCSSKPCSLWSGTQIKFSPRWLRSFATSLLTSPVRVLIYTSEVALNAWKLLGGTQTLRFGSQLALRGAGSLLPRWHTTYFDRGLSVSLIIRKPHRNIQINELHSVWRR